MGHRWLVTIYIFAATDLNIYFEDESKARELYKKVQEWLLK